MRRIALTGGIATGKSHVLRVLRERGIPTIDADDIVHEATRAGTPTTQKIALHFGSAALNPDGSVDRAALGHQVFADRESRLRLESIVHPMVYETIDGWFTTVEGPVAVACIPLLFETHHEGDFDVVIVTSCKPEQQLQRIIERDGLSEEEARRRLAAQMPTEEKARRAHFVISTAGSRAETERQVEELLVKLTAGN